MGLKVVITRYDEMVEKAVEEAVSLDEFAQYLFYKLNCFGGIPIKNYKFFKK